MGGGSPPPPQRNDPVGLKLRAVGLKIMCLFACSALRSKLNIFETRDRMLKRIKQLRSNIKKYYVLISRVYERIIIQNTRKGMKFPFTFQTWRYLYVTITCWHFYLEFRSLQGHSRVTFYISENFKPPKSDSKMR